MKEGDKADNTYYLYWLSPPSCSLPEEPEFQNKIELVQILTLSK